MQYILFIDDERTLDMVDTSNWPVDSNGRLLTVFTVRSSAEARSCVELSGPPVYMSLDHDLGDTDRTMEFLKWLTNDYNFTTPVVCPRYGVHSANPIGQKNMESYLESWIRSQTL